MLGNGLALGLLETFTRTRFWSMYREMCRIESEPRVAGSEIGKTRLAHLLRHASASVPFWQRLFAEREIDPNSPDPLDTLSRLPITSKETYKIGFPEEVTSQSNRDDWRYFTSAGTTDRLSVVTDFCKRDFIRATTLRTLGRTIGSPMGTVSAEIPPHACNVVCGLADDGPAELLPYLFWSLRNGHLIKKEKRPDLRGRLERTFLVRRNTLLPIEPKTYEQLQQSLDDRLDKILAANPRVIRALPVFLVWLAQCAEQRNLRFPRLRAVLPFGGLTAPSMAERIGRGFGAPFLDVYGTGEVGEMASESEPGAGLDVYEDLFHIEVLDANGHPCHTGEMGRIVVTDLTNFAMPILRYEIGDMGRWEERDGRYKLIVLGRRQEVVSTPRGPVCSRELADLLFQDERIMNFRMEERSPGEFLLKVVAPDPIEKNKLAQRLQEHLAISQPPQVRIVPFLRPEGSGKYRMVESHESRNRVLV